MQTKLKHIYGNEIKLTYSMASNFLSEKPVGFHVIDNETMTLIVGFMCSYKMHYIVRWQNILCATILFVQTMCLREKNDGKENKQ